MKDLEYTNSLRQKVDFFFKFEKSLFRFNSRRNIPQNCNKIAATRGWGQGRMGSYVFNGYRVFVLR